jgi:hypothetical protein
MKNLLIKIAYKILCCFGVEDFPIFYFNGNRYYIRSYEFHHDPSLPVNTLTIIAEDTRHDTLV